MGAICYERRAIEHIELTEKICATCKTSRVLIKITSDLSTSARTSRKASKETTETLSTEQHIAQ